MDSCREMFKTMEMLPFYSQYIFSRLLCVVNNKHLFIKHLEVHNHDTRSANNFHLPSTNLTKYQNGAHFAGIKIVHHGYCYEKYHGKSCWGSYRNLVSDHETDNATFPAWCYHTLCYVSIL
jgi:hypothetical protein